MLLVIIPLFPDFFERQLRSVQIYREYLEERTLTPRLPAQCLVRAGCSRDICERGLEELTNLNLGLPTGPSPRWVRHLLSQPR